MIPPRPRAHDLWRAVLGASLAVAAPLAYAALLADAWRPRGGALRARQPRHRPVQAWWLWFAIAGGVAFTLAALVADGASHGSVAAAWVALTALAAIATRVISRGRPAAAGNAGALALGAVTAAVAVSAYAVTAAWLTGERVSGWAAHPNIWGAHLAASFVAALVVLAASRRPRAHLVVASLGVVAIATTGSRTAIAAMVIGTLATWFVGLATKRFGTSLRHHLVRLLAALSFLAVILVTTVLVLPAGGRMLPGSGEAPANRLIASEDLNHPAWIRRDVTVKRLANDVGAAVHQLEAQALDGLARLHQRQLLRPGETMTFSLEFGPEGPHAGVLGFGADGGRLQLQRDGSIAYAPSTPRILAHDATRLADGWTLLALSIVHDGAEPLVWRLGIAPTLRADEAASVRVRRASLVVGLDAGTYRGTTPEDDARTRAELSAAQRLAYLPLALRVASERWLFGHGRAPAFADLAAATVPERLSATDRPRHPHNLLLDLLVAYGLIGVTGFAMLALGWWGALPHQARSWTLPFVLTLAVCNFGDATLLTGGPEYAALALLLWWHRTLALRPDVTRGAHRALHRHLPGADC